MSIFEASAGLVVLWIVLSAGMLTLWGVLSWTIVGILRRRSDHGVTEKDAKDAVPTDRCNPHCI
jgi:hypothetical protein